MQPAFDLDAHGRHAQAVRFSHDGTFLLSAGQDAKIHRWKATDFRLTRTYEGHDACVNSLSLSPDDRRLVTGSTDKTVCLWTIRDGRRRLTFEKQMIGVFSPGGDAIATFSPRGEVTVWDAAAGRSLARVVPLGKR